MVFAAACHGEGITGRPPARTRPALNEPSEVPAEDVCLAEPSHVSNTWRSTRRSSAHAATLSCLKDRRSGRAACRSPGARGKRACNAQRTPGRLQRRVQPCDWEAPSVRAAPPAGEATSISCACTRWSSPACGVASVTESQVQLRLRPMPLLFCPMAVCGVPLQVASLARTGSAAQGGGLPEGRWADAACLGRSPRQGRAHDRQRARPTAPYSWAHGCVRSDPAGR